MLLVFEESFGGSNAGVLLVFDDQDSNNCPIVLEEMGNKPHEHFLKATYFRASQIKLNTLSYILAYNSNSYPQQHRKEAVSTAPGTCFIINFDLSTR